MILLTFSLFLFPFYCQAYNSVSINSLANITKITQDKQGFIWLAGHQGLTRVDNHGFITFSITNNEWPQPYSWVHNISFIDDKMLIATEVSGLWLFNPQSGKSEKVLVESVSQNYYHAVVFNGQYYINDTNSFYKFTPETQETNVINSELVIDRISHTQKQLYISNNNGLYQLKNEKLIQVIDEPITALTALSDAVIAITPKHIFKIHDSGTVKTITHDEKIYGLTKHFTNDSFFTVSNKGKINKYNSNTLTTLPHHYVNVKPVHPTSLFHDSSGVLWLASSQGVQQLTENYITNYDVLFDISINANEITLFNNEIIIGSYGAGLQNFLKPVFNDDVNDGFTKQGLKIFDVLEVNESLYIASKDGLWEYNKQTNQVIKLDFMANKLILKLNHKNNLLYIATNSEGVYIYDLVLNKVIKHLKVSDGLFSSEIIDVLPLPSNKLWIASNNHINIYHPYTNEITTLVSPNQSKVISLVFIDNKIFASTLGDGILVFNQNGDLLTQISNNHSFTEMIVVKDEIWISGKPGLYRLSPLDYKITMIANTQQYTFVSSMLVKNETLYAIHYSGVLALNLSEQVKFNPNVTISQTTISGQSYLLNKSIEIKSGNDVITLDLASLDYRPGLTKKYKYRINNNPWQKISTNQLTLTGLASGDYNVEIMATNSLGQWSDFKAYTDIHVASPWYWTVELQIIYALTLIFIVLLTTWLLYLRTKSIKHIHTLLKDDMRSCGKTMKIVQRNLHFAASSLENDEYEQGKLLIDKCLQELNDNIISQEPDSLTGKSLVLAIPFLADYIKSKYQVNLNITLDEKIDTFDYELRADIYKIIFEALMSGIFKNEASDFKLTIQEVKSKLWITLSCDSDCFSQFDSKINFDLASYTIRQITNKHNASLNTFENDDGTSQLVISFPLMTLN